MREALTLELGVEAFAPVVAIGGEVQAQPVPAADDGRGQVHAREPGREEETPCQPTGRRPTSHPRQTPARLRPRSGLRVQPGPIGDLISAQRTGVCPGMRAL